MEVAGTVLGVAGLAGLLSACLDCYQLIDRGSHMSRDYRILETKLNNQELRLATWGRACGLVHGHEYDPRLDEPGVSQQIEDTLECIRGLLNDEKEMRARYGLKKTLNTRNSLPQLTERYPSFSHATAKLGSFFQMKREQTHINPSSGIGIMSVARWVISDREKFAELVQHLKDFNDDLETLTRATEIPHRQRSFVLYEIEELDTESLQELEAAGLEESDIVSDTASLVLDLRSVGIGSVRSSFTIETATGSYYSAFGSVTALRMSRMSGLSLKSFMTASEGTSFVTAPSQPDLAVQPPIPLLKRLPHLSQVTRRGKPDNVLKCIAVGDTGVPTTALLNAMIGNAKPDYQTISFSESRVSVKPQTDSNQSHRNWDVSLHDIAGQADYPMLRRSSYRFSDMVLLCYKHQEVHDRTRLKEWLEELGAHCPDAIIALIEIGPIGYSEDCVGFVNTTELRKLSIGGRQVKYSNSWCCGDEALAKEILLKVTSLAIESKVKSHQPPTRSKTRRGVLGTVEE